MFNVGALFTIIWKEILLILFVMGLFILGGLYYSFTAREEFVSSGKILPEIQGKGMGGLGQFAGLASLAGVDIGGVGNSTDAIRPDLYPDVIKSTPFFLELFKIKVRTKANKEIMFEQFYQEVIEENAPIKSRLREKPPVKEDGILVLSALNEKRIKKLRTRILASIDKKSGLITIETKMPDPVVAADVTKFAMRYLTDYVTAYRIGKLKREVDFLSERVAISRGKFYSNQERKAQYSDQFQAPTIKLQSADVQRERLESEYRLSSSFYNELLKKLEEAKIRLRQETPVFKILEPPSVPNLKSEPKRFIVLLFSSIVGAFVGFIVILFKKGNFRKILVLN